MEQHGKTIGQWSQRGRGDQFAEVSISSEKGQGRHTTRSGKFEWSEIEEKRKYQFINREMKNYAIKYHKKKFMLSPARIRVYLSTNFVLKTYAW